MTTVIVSDLHINGNFQAGLFVQTMEMVKERGCRKLIINGDAMEHSAEAIDVEHLKAIECLRKMQDSGIAIIRVRGNHDLSGKDLLNEVLKIPSLKEYKWKVNGKVFLARHGHQFDRFISRNMLASKLMSLVFLFLQKWDLRSRWFTRMLDRLHGMWFGLSDMVARGAIRYALRKKIDVIFCGHTHQGVHIYGDKKGRRVHYWNTGGWVDQECSFVTVDDQGEVELYKVWDIADVLM